jgi:hypothetical protein
VTRLALASPSLPTEVSTAVTIATPHQGADVATLLASIRAKPGADQVIGQLGPVAGIDPMAIAPAQLAERSSLLTGLESPPERVRFLSIGARGDLVVPARSTRVAGATNVVVPAVGSDAHQRLVAAPETARAIALTLANLPMACESFGDVVLDSSMAQLVTGIESVAAGLVEWPRIPRPLRPRQEPPS